MSPQKITPAQRRAFGRKVDSILKQNDKLFRTAQKQTLGHVASLQRDIRGAIIMAEGFEQRHLRGILSDLDASRVRFETRFNADLATSQDQVWELGGKMTSETFATIGIELALPVLPESLLVATKDYTADLITEMGRGTIEQVSGHIRRGIIAGRSPYETARLINKDVLQKKGLGTYWRAETITRTETNRVFNIANQERKKQAKDQIPDLMKEWRSEPGARKKFSKRLGRLIDHGAANGQVRRVDEPFDVGGEKLDYPGDPKGQPENVINCRCQSLPWRKAWT